MSMFRHVLIVDDMAVNRRLAQALFKRLGVETASATSGVEALSLTAQQGFDLVLLDISMPEMSGIEVCQRIRGDPRLKHLAVVAYTAHAMPEEHSRLIEHGFDDVLIKPVTPDSLERVLGKLSVRRPCVVYDINRC